MGKSETWLMVEFVSNAHLYFRGEDTENYAYVDVKLYGNGGDFNSFTGEVSNILEGNLDILPRNIYISYAAFNDWGNNGSNF